MSTIVVRALRLGAVSALIASGLVAVSAPAAQAATNCPIDGSRNTATVYAINCPPVQNQARAVAKCYKIVDDTYVKTVYGGWISAGASWTTPCPAGTEVGYGWTQFS